MSHTRRTILKAGSAIGAGAAIGGLRTFTAQAEEVDRPASVQLVSEQDATTFFHLAPAVESRIIEQGLPIGNGRLGALVGGNPANDSCYVTDVSLWAGDKNDVLDNEGQFPYERVHFGTFNVLAQAAVSIPEHAPNVITKYRRTLDISNGIVTSSYEYKGTRYRREVYSSHPDDVIVMRLTRDGRGTHTGTISITGTHNESTVDGTISGKLDNGLKYAAVVQATSKGGRIGLKDNKVTFTDCAEVVIVISGGTNYVPRYEIGYMNASADPLAIARDKATKALKASGDALLATHVRDYQSLYNRMTVDFGRSSRNQRSMDTWSRLVVRGTPGAAADPELEASYLQFGRYLMITGSRDNLPLNLQGLWLHNNTPDWMADYHTDVNVQMNYWMADRAGLSDCFEPFADYCVAQLPGWTKTTQELFLDPRNRFRNSSGKVGGWAVAYSTNIYGGSGWWWHSGGNAWICNSLWEHYEYTQDRAYLAKIYPLLKGACEFWEHRLIMDPVRQKLVADKDWSPEHGPQDAIGITYAQELCWDLFEHFRAASSILNKDRAYAQTIAGLQEKLYMPEVSPKSGWLQEWMSPDNLGETTHRHLSGLIGFFPGDRIKTDTSPPELVEGVRQQLIARGMDSFGWACAWRALCWARLKDADRAYQLIQTVMRPSVSNSNGTAPNLFDMYSQGSYAIFQIDANFGAPAAMIEMLVYSRPGLIELLPALPAQWAKTGKITGVGARGGFTVDVSWRDGKVTSATVHSTTGTDTVVQFGSWRKNIRLRPGQSVTVRP
ncbi:glycoside hydrolase family 95 protein [Kibdelosporangium aridum]|uniref:Glycoside hydrolase family 95 protein n=1 Tax=Kibdelosporangium aridum TaxID=2030 RepID=A0A428YRZ9_KIBAR|nr:glycoside hydrolase N-terminal domain-containing protein [Kibdelosporangium aridum]RSM71825.1 glycoside hydrolase family 95 protein [Kibdelosporangium aridum]